MPVAYVPVRSARNPMIYGPAKPPSAPTELIVAIPMAEEVPANREVDADQKGAWRAVLPIAATVRAKTPVRAPRPPGIGSQRCATAVHPYGQSSNLRAM